LPYVAAWTDSRVEQVRAFKHWVYVGIDRVATRVAKQLPNVSWVHHDGSSAKARQKIQAKCLSPYARSKALLPLMSHEHLEPVPSNHPLLRLLKSPNDVDTTFDFLYETILFLLLTGSAYWWFPRDPVFHLPVALFVVPSHWMWPVTGRDRLIEAWEIRPVEGNYLRKRLPYDEVIVFRKKSPISKIDGWAPLTAGANWVDIQDSMNRAKWHSYRNGTFPSVAVQFDGKLQDPSDEDLRRIEAKFLARYVGEIRSNKPLFLPPGVKVVPLTIKPNEMVFGETASEVRDSILGLLGVPASIAISKSSGTYGANVADQATFLSGTVNPLYTFLGQTLTERLAVPNYDERLRVWWEDQTPDDPEMIERRLQTDMMGAAITPNELRVLRGREPLPYEWANEPIMPVNMQFGTTAFGGRHVNPPPSVTAPTTDRDPDDNHKSQRVAGRAWEELLNNPRYAANGNGHGH
jgi:HK97 family phage portal protein